MNSIFSTDEDFCFSDDDTLEVNFFCKKQTDQKDSLENGGCYETQSKEDQRQLPQSKSFEECLANTKTDYGSLKRKLDTRKPSSHQFQFVKKFANGAECSDKRKNMMNSLLPETANSLIGNQEKDIFQIRQEKNPKLLANEKYECDNEALKRTYNFLESRNATSNITNMNMSQSSASNHKNCYGFELSSSKKYSRTDKIRPLYSRDNGPFKFNRDDKLLSVSNQRFQRTVFGQNLECLGSDLDQSSSSHSPNVSVPLEPISSSLNLEKSIFENKRQENENSDNFTISKASYMQEKNDSNKDKSQGCMQVVTSTERKCPGPAGLLPKLKSMEDINNLTAYSPINVSKSMSTSKDALPSSLFKMDQDEDFLKPFWLNLQKEAMAKCKGMRCLTIDAVLGKATQNQLEKGKVPMMYALIRSLSYNGPDASIVLKDPTGEIHGTVHERVCENYEKELSAGAGIILTKVSIFSPSTKKHYVNITPSNIVMLVPAELSEPSTQVTQLSQRIPEIKTTSNATNEPDDHSLADEDSSEKNNLENLFEDADDDWLDDTAELCI